MAGPVRHRRLEVLRARSACQESNLEPESVLADKSCEGRPVPQIRLIKKYAAALDGFDLTDAQVGDVLLVTDEVAAMITREGWGEPVSNDDRGEASSDANSRAVSQAKGARTSP